MSAKLRPLGDRVIVKPLEQEEMTASGIILPETAKEKPQKGVVLAVGPGSLKEDGTRNPMDVSVDDVVIFAKYAGTEFKLDEDDKVLVLRQSDILAIFEE